MKRIVLALAALLALTAGAAVPAISARNEDREQRLNTEPRCSRGLQEKQRKPAWQ